jgi:hypothetical protein
MKYRKNEKKTARKREDKGRDIQRKCRKRSTEKTESIKD